MMDELQRLLNIRGIGPVWAQRILAMLTEASKSVDDLFAMSPDLIKQQFGLPKNIIRGIAELAPSDVERPFAALLKQKDIKILDLDSPDYPIRLKQVLGKQAPKVVYAWGNLSLLNRQSVGFCGSRSASELGIAVTADTAQQIVEQGWVVVSGHAKGVDAKAHETALRNGGATIIVLAEGILGFKLRSELRKLAKPDQILVISQFDPQAHWHVGYAMTRNSTIIALSNAMILVEARTEGGTFEAGKEALRLKIPLYVAKYETPADSASGNAYFMSRGAISLSKNRETGKANIASLKEKVLTSDVSSAKQILLERAEQLSLL